jgi:hypothetical protein
MRGFAVGTRIMGRTADQCNSGYHPHFSRPAAGLRQPFYEDTGLRQGGRMRWLMAVVLIIGCSTEPSRATLEGRWGLQTVNGQTLPHPYVDTVPLPAGDTVFSSGTLIADTIVLRSGNPSERRTWLDDGPFTVGVTWSDSGPGDSVTVTEIFNAGLVDHHGVFAGDALTLRIVSLVRPGVYQYARVP